MTRAFHYVNDTLFCEQQNLEQLAKKVSTPFYVYSQSRIEHNCQIIKQAGEGLNFLPCYALKANYNPAILQLVQKAGFGADVVSGGELIFALKAGFHPQKIVYAGVGKNDWEIELAIKTGIHSINVESAEEFFKIKEIASRLQRKVALAFRINPDIEASTHEYITTGKHLNKFGITVNEALDLYKKAADDEWLVPLGLHVHIGSQITKIEPFLKTAEYLNQIIRELRAQNLPVTILDLGGGIGIDYEDDFRSEDRTHPLKELLPGYLQAFKDSGVQLVVELGRSIIGDAGLLVTRVLYRKQTPKKKFLIVDAAMNNLIRPSLYNAYHAIVPLQLAERTVERFDVVGPVCESGDFFAKDRELPVLEQGECLAIVGAGAYGQALASNYNLRPLIPEYLVKDEQVKQIFKGETIEDIANRYEW